MKRRTFLTTLPAASITWARDVSPEPLTEIVCPALTIDGSSRNSSVYHAI